MICAVSLVAAVAAYAASAVQDPRYRSSAQLLVDASAAQAGAAGDPSRALDTLVKLTKTQDVLEVAARSAGTSPRSLARATTVTGDPTADIITVSAVAPSAEQARRYAGALATGVVAWRAERVRSVARVRVSLLRTQLAQLAGKKSPSAVAAAADLQTQLAEEITSLQGLEPDVTVVTSASLPASPFAPHPARNALLALLAGGIVAVAAAALKDRLDRRIRDIGELERLYGLPTLGHVPVVRTAGRASTQPVLADFGRGTALADAFRTIRSNLALFQLDRDTARVLLISSAVPAEGKTTVTANLARAVAAGGQSVLAISADVRSPMLHTYFGPPHSVGTNDAAGASRGATPTVRQAAGLVDVLSGDVPFDQAVREFGATGAVDGASRARIGVLANERTFFDPALLYQSKAMATLLQRARERYDIVLIDSPPLLAGAGATMLARHGDAVVVVANPDLVTRTQVERTIAMLETARIRPLGLIVAARADELELGYGYGHGADGKPSGTIGVRALVRNAMRRERAR
jgi:Mrp family chromosome partitioning ATPase